MEFKNLFLTKRESAPAAIIEEEPEEQSVRITYYQTGYGAAQKAMGAPLNFKACLQTVYNNFVQQCREQEAEQRRLKQPYIEEKNRKHSELKNAEAAISIFEEKKQTFAEKVNEIKKVIEDVKQNPEDHGITSTKRPKAQFYIGLLLLIPITIYLFIFYISATYSAFFKIFSDDKIAAAIFDAKAFTNALNDGWLEAALIITIPSVFLGLGYVIHMMQKEKGIKNVFRIVALYLVTFLFDALLAYQIEKKIYEFQKTMESKPYDLQIALGEAEFWMIIFAGFVVYIIWGLVFDIIMKEHENMDKIKIFITSKREEIRRLEEEKLATVEEINILKQKIADISGKITELQGTIDGFVLNLKQYLLYHSQYKEGWFQAVASEIALPLSKQNEILSECEQIANEHLETLGLHNSSFENVTYAKIY